MTLYSSNLPVAVRDVLIDIEYASHVPPGFKLNLKNRSYSSTGIWEGLYRATYGENRHATLEWLDSLIDRSIYICNQHPVYCNIILSKVKELSSCINNLMAVYSDIPLIRGKLSILLMRIDLDSMKKAVSEYKPNIVEAIEIPTEECQKHLNFE
jgi:hypothetical protein